MKFLPKNPFLLLLIVLVWYVLLTDLQFTNEVVVCEDISYRRKCDLQSTDKDLIQQNLRGCFNGTFDTLILEIGMDFGGVTIHLTPTTLNIQVLEIINSADTNCYIETTGINSNLKEIKFSGNEIYLKQNSFFTYFPNLETIQLNSLGSRFIPIFTKNRKVRFISVQSSRIEEENSRIINETIFGGLDKLKYIVWANGGINGITRNALNGLTELSGISLNGNNILELFDCTFEGLGKLATIVLDGNNISTVGPNTFLGLNNVIQLFLNQNPNFPLSSLIPMKNLQILFLNGYNTKYLERQVIEQFPKLMYLYLLQTSINCSCEQQWVTQLEHFGIYVFKNNQGCLGEASRQASNSTLYTNCENRSFQCFNKSIECVGENWTRVDTVDGCECIYPEESYTVSEICNEVDECEDSSICQGNCTNTIGSYKCDCLEGFYNVSDTLCSDIDECIVDNGNCTHNCTNSLGSFECSCLPGYQKMGFSGCVDINECSLNNGNCSHNCTNTVGSYECSCLPGFLKHGFTECSLTNECNDPFHFHFLIYILVFLSLVFFLIAMILLLFLIIVFLYFKRKLKSLKPTFSPSIIPEQDHEEITVTESPIP